MIATLAGALAVRDAGRIVVETGGIGYEVLIPLSTYYRLPQLGEHVALEIRQVVREDALGKGDVERIDAVPGVGPKVAERVVRELRDKVGDLKLAAPSTSASNGHLRAVPDGNGKPSGPADEAVSALVNLGMKPVEAKRTVDAVIAADAGSAQNPEVIIRKSLAVLLGER
jgi:Holliday junction DNA helicase RuvA